MYEQGLLDVIKQQLEKQINDEYTEYKEKCLDELDSKIEMKRKGVVNSILDSVNVYIQKQEPFTNEPAINIRIETHPIVKLEDK